MANMTFADARFNGRVILTSPFLVEDGPPVEVRRTWKERLCSRPWRPWVRTKTIVPKVPSTQIIQVGDRLYMHPQMQEKLLSLTGKDRT